MLKFLAAFRKEWLILIRDIAGLIVLFIMPTIMVVILALVQEFGWNSVLQEPQFPVLLITTTIPLVCSLNRDSPIQSFSK